MSRTLSSKNLALRNINLLSLKGGSWPGTTTMAGSLEALGLTCPPFSSQLLLPFSFQFFFTLSSTEPQNPPDSPTSSFLDQAAQARHL